MASAVGTGNAQSDFDGARAAALEDLLALSWPLLQCKLSQHRRNIELNQLRFKFGN